MGYLLYANKATLFAVPFDLDKLETRGTALPVLDDVGYNPASFESQFDVSRDGTLVYRKADAALAPANRRPFSGWMPPASANHWSHSRLRTGQRASHPMASGWLRRSAQTERWAFRFTTCSARPGASSLSIAAFT